MGSGQLLVHLGGGVPVALLAVDPGRSFQLHYGGIGAAVGPGECGEGLGRARPQAGRAVVVGDLHELGGGDAAARVERDLLAHVTARVGVAQVAHHVDQVDELVRLEREDPLVVAEAERRDRVGDDAAVGRALAAVLGETARGFGLRREPRLSLSVRRAGKG